MRQSTPTITTSTTVSLLITCFVFSGATGLIYEVLWARMLGLVFGATIIAISAVLCAFMAGLACGSWIAARAASRLARPIFVYGTLEIIIGLYALAVPALFRATEWVYTNICRHWQPGYYKFALARFALASLVLFVPTTLMGATLPVLAAAARHLKLAQANTVSKLYAGNLAGAIAGALAAGFLLLPSLGVKNTIILAAAVNLLIGLAALMIDRGQVRERTFSDLTRVGSTLVAIEDAGFWLLCAFVSGLVTIGMQLVWSRLLAMIIGSSTYAFSIVLALFLTGLAIGAWLVSRMRWTDVGPLRRAVLWIQIFTALSLFLSVLITNAVPEFLLRAGFALNVNSWTGLLSMQIAAAGIIIIVPAVLMGMILPLVLLRGQLLRAVETVPGVSYDSVRFIGYSYALNTFGAIGGSLFTAFVLIPKMGSRTSIMLFAACCVIVAGIAYLPGQETSDRAMRRSFSAGLTALVIIGMLAGWPRLNLDRLSIGAYDSFVRVLAKSRGAAADNPQNANPATENHELLMFDEGRSATVSVRKDWNITSLAINGRTNASDSEDMPTQIMLGQLGVLLAPRLNNSLIVGFATGVTAGAVLQSPLQSVVCVEIEQAAVTASRFFEHVNEHPLSDQRLHVIIDDARTYLKVNETKYDLIVSEPSHPWVPGVANLFTREFFTLGRARLSDDGVFVQWLQTYQLSSTGLQSVLATFHEVFPHVLVFRVQGPGKGKDLILVGSAALLNLDRVNERMADARIAREVNRAGIGSAADLRDDWFVCDEGQLNSALAGAHINSDDNMLIETRAPREAFRPTMEDNAAWIESLKRAKAGN